MGLSAIMGFVKVIKNRSYFSRFQVKYKRRRQCKTDYYARKKLILQDKNKYKTPKYRFVVRFTNKDISCQIFSSDLTHDHCVVAAYSHELQRYGVKLGLTNYAAAYCTGLLLARRLNDKFKLDYECNTEDLGNYYEVEANDEGPAPFSAILDVGLKPTTTGSRLFGCLKGACDGGVDIPHRHRRFPRPKGSSVDDEDLDEESVEFHRKYIFGGHVAEFMNKLKDDDEEAYKKQFSRYIAEGIDADDLEGIYEAAHAAIREDPFRARGGTELGRHKTRKDGSKEKGYVYKTKKWPCHPTKLTIDQRKARVRAKLQAMGKPKVYKQANVKRKRAAAIEKLAQERRRVLIKKHRKAGLKANKPAKVVKKVRSKTTKKKDVLREKSEKKREEKKGKSTPAKKAKGGKKK